MQTWLLHILFAFELFWEYLNLKIQKSETLEQIQDYNEWLNIKKICKMCQTKDGIAH